ncbi:type IX secretion system membrane protein, PorP/SprF family [Aquimarina amphilecti]|uniref:Type IX secretion system membrane protein, PorP/SprF family n=1 Tax=Aquimarina amphilecti TaxID=1038014 RepID=A0A1H7JYF0_AQUAM|nr:PorP/SprF family type IX secretion system membrane protein [Aquimarina amphilecti]SEK78645.1 type IX secretion system membrane protein, PorP/SprF family [Aquimarina amphilecti]
MIKKILYISAFIFCSHLVNGQDGSSNTSGILPSDIPLHNSLKYNRFMFNPTFSLVRENKNSINIYNRNPRASFSDNSQTYFLNYSARFEEKTGIGVGLFQQNVGIFRFFGATLNYAYNIELNRDMNFTFGVNLSYSQSALKSNLDEAQVNDDIINNYENSSVFLLRPGVNFNYGNFDVGVSVGNLVTYNLTASELLTDNFEYSGHVMYTTELDWRRIDNELRGMVYASKPGEQDLRYGGNVLFEIPKYGWAQLGYNSFYGGSIGIGANITKTVSIGYTVEPGIGGDATAAEFGATHEFGLAFNFAKEERRSKRRNISSKSSLQRDSEIRRLKKEILDQNKIIRELQKTGGDSLSQAQRTMNRLERSIQEAKEEEARKARELALQREEEVKLLNKQAEELAAQKKLELEMSEQKAEEERLATQKNLELEIEERRKAEEAAGIQAEEARIAAEEAAREAEAEEQEAAAEAVAEQKRQAQEATRLAAEEAAEIERQEIAATEAKQQADAEAAKQEEERLAAQKKLEVEIAEQKAEEERLAAQKKLELEMAEQKAEEERLAAQKKLELEMAEQKRREESQKTLEREVSVQKDKEAEAARLAEEERLRQEAETARLAEEERLRQEAETARLAEEERLRQEAEAARLAEEERLRQEAEASRLAEEERLRQEAEAARLAEEERQRQEAEAARLAEEERLRQEAEAARLAEEERLRQEAETARLAEEERQRQEAEAARLAEEERLRQEAETARLAEEERQRQEAEAARLAEEERLRQEAEATRLAEEERLRQEAEATRLAEEERQRQEAEAARLAEEERQRQEAEATRLAEEERQRQEAEATRLAEEERQRQEAEAARLAEEERQRQEAEAENNGGEDLEQIQKELDNSSRITDKLIASRDSLLTSSKNLDKREFNKLLESLVSMNDQAEEVKNNNDPTSSKRLTSKNRFIKFAEATRPEAKYATKYIPGYPEGFYLIGNVFRGGTYAESFTNKLKDLGFNDSQVIVNPENQYQYVAIKYYANKEEAAENYLNNIGNKYFGDMWILNIAKSRVESLKRLVQESRLIKDTVKDDTVLTESLSYIGGHNIENGYYLITNIFKRENYFERGMEKLKSQGLEPKFFRNPKDNYIYVYLNKFDTLDNAKQSLFSNVNNTYNGDLYILKIE